MRKRIHSARTGIVILLILLFTIINYFNKGDTTTPGQEPATQVQLAYANQESKVQVNGSGVIVAVLKDDLKGAQHQRFIVRLSESLTVLIAHNIDLAPRVDGIQKGETISFYGVYEWNNKGGVIHWTHHDPQKHHIDGWIEYQGKIYQ